MIHAHTSFFISADTVNPTPCTSRGALSLHRNCLYVPAGYNEAALTANRRGLRRHFGLHCPYAELARQP